MSQPSSKLGRRSLLLGFGSFALTQLVHACGLRGRSPKFVVEFLASSIPASLLQQIETQIQVTRPLKLTPFKQLADSQLASQLRTFQQTDDENTRPSKASLPNLTSIGDSWLALAIQAQSLQPLKLTRQDQSQPDQAQQPGWERLPSKFQQLVQRDEQGMPDASGDIWAAPYRWGQLMIAYRADKLAASGWVPTDWSSLWDEPIRRRLSLPDHERLVLGLVLKALGQSANTPMLDSVEDLSERLASLQQQVKVYSSDNYLQPLFLEDTWVAVGWSMDILPVVRRDPRIEAIIPASGTILTADLWVQPRQSATPDTSPESDTPEANVSQSEDQQLTAQLLRRWIDFFWQPDTAIQLSLLSNAASPAILDADLVPDASLEPPAALTNDSLLIPDAEIMTYSDFILPLEEGAIAQYQQYWQAMRTQG